MAKRNTLTHPKTGRLAEALSVPRWAALGLLEAVWHWCGTYARTGEIKPEDWPELADWVRFSTGGDRLRDVLVKTDWIDESNGATFVHDWPDHADDAVKKALARSGQSFHRHYKKRTTSGRCRDAVATAERLPEPSQAKPEPEPSHSERSAGFQHSATPPPPARSPAEAESEPDPASEDPAWPEAIAKLREWLVDWLHPERVPNLGGPPDDEICVRILTAVHPSPPMALMGIAARLKAMRNRDRGSIESWAYFVTALRGGVRG